MNAGRKTSRSVGDARGLTSSRSASSNILTIRGQRLRGRRPPGARPVVTSGHGGSELLPTTLLRRDGHPGNRFCHVPSPVGRNVGVAADARMAADGHMLFRATETTETPRNILLLLGVLLRARIVRIQLEHGRFVDVEQV